MCETVEKIKEDAWKKVMKYMRLYEYGPYSSTIGLNICSDYNLIVKCDLNGPKRYFTVSIVSIHEHEILQGMPSCEYFTRNVTKYELGHAIDVIIDLWLNNVFSVSNFIALRI